MKKTIIVFSLLLITFFFLINIGSFIIYIENYDVEMVLTLLALSSLGIGLFISMLGNKKHTELSHLLPNPVQENSILSKREYEVLLKISEGKSNKEIGIELYLSESTIKTHVSNLVVKLKAKRRTQAVSIAKKMNLVI